MHSTTYVSNPERRTFSVCFFPFSFIIVISTTHTGKHDLSGLHHCTGLRKLDLVFHNFSDISATVCEVLSYIRSRNLASINILDKNGNDFFVRSWRRVDEKLADEQFINLKAFTVQTTSDRLGTQLAVSMPSSNERGILRVVDVNA
jgi:hypothetical protein